MFPLVYISPHGKCITRTFGGNLMGMFYMQFCMNTTSSLSRISILLLGYRSHYSEG